MLGNILDNKTTETFTKAQQLSTDLNKLNVLIEGKLAFDSFSLFHQSIHTNTCTFTVLKGITYVLKYTEL